MPSTEHSEAKIASILMSIGAVSLNPTSPYTWASGLLSPIYCDNRLLLGHPEERNEVIKSFTSVLEAHQLEADLIAGTATAGIPHAAWLAQRLDLPMVYVRPKPKSHGRMNQVEGPIHAGQSAIIIEDLISTGMSSIGAVRALVEEGVKVISVLAIFSYQLDQAFEKFESAGVSLHTLCTFETLLQVAADENRITERELAALQNWRADPDGWSDAQKNRE